MHGGAQGTGAPRGERNGNYRHGRRTIEAMAERRRLMEFIREARRLRGGRVMRLRQAHAGKPISRPQPIVDVTAGAYGAHPSRRPQGNYSLPAERATTAAT
jgi:hypothetical protein